MRRASVEEEDMQANGCNGNPTCDRWHAVGYPDLKEIVRSNRPDEQAESVESMTPVNAWC